MLDQRLPLTVNMLEVNCVQIPTVTQPFVSQHKAHMGEMVNYLLIDVAQVYKVYMISGLLLMRRWVWNAYSIIILADNCGCGVICHCGMSRGRCWILGTTLSRVFWQLTWPLKRHIKYLLFPTLYSFIQIRSTLLTKNVRLNISVKG